MGNFAACALVLFGFGCQPMYAGPSERLPRIAKIPHKVVSDPAPVTPYVDTCAANFRADPTAVRIDTARSLQLAQSGDDSLQQATKVTDPTSQGQAISVGIDHYRNALSKDPYNAEITLKLALAYDKVYRKGCALKLLARISVLESHPRFHAAARRVVDQVSDTPEWFKGYRQEAISAIGGTGPASAPGKP